MECSSFLKPALFNMHLPLRPLPPEQTITRASSSLSGFKISQVSGLCIEREISLFSWKYCKENNILK